MKLLITNGIIIFLIWHYKAYVICDNLKDTCEICSCWPSVHNVMYSIVEILLFGGIMLIMAFIITLSTLPGTLEKEGPFCRLLLSLLVFLFLDYVSSCYF